MKIARSVAEYQRPEGMVAFVPTMGALHDGHLSLMESAAKVGKTVVSIFVNPTQFGPSEDFAKYPRPIEEDLRRLESAGVDTVFTPSADEMYSKHPTLVHVPDITERFEGEFRPGHFDGVGTIVLKLINIVRPDLAVFGQKDLQQCAVIRKVLSDLNVPAKLMVAPTVREPDGLAMSSRNRYLSAAEREHAPMIYSELLRAKSDIESGTSVPQVLKDARARLQTAGFRLDYLEFIDSNTWQPTKIATSGCALIIAAFLGTTRLIDNVLIDS